MTCAMRMRPGIAGGADLKAVMERLGHSQIQTTQQYLHTLPEADRQAFQAFQRVRGRTSSAVVDRPDRDPQQRRPGYSGLRS